ncbi:MAG: aspartate aminotransferase family protein [Chitinophagaceae bacterium]
MNLRQLFLQHNAQTSGSPMLLEIVKAEGCELTDASGKTIIEAIQKQIDAYLHVMVYGEFVQTPQVQYARALTESLPVNLNSVYFTNSGAEAVEAAMKLAKKATGRTEIIAFNHSYHGSTQGALSIIGDEYWRNAFRPLLPGVQHLNYNSFDDLDFITDQTACVFAETVQAEAGIVVPQNGWLPALQKRCTDTGTLLILDEVQAGFGRSGLLWGFQHFNIEPDILVLGKALGGGMPLGAFIASRELMKKLADNPVLGHITTFGGHPVCCAAGLAAFNVLKEENIISRGKEKEDLFRNLLIHPEIKTIRSFGLWLALELDSVEICKKVVGYCIDSGVITDWFLFAPHCLRISPPLTISNEQIEQSAKIILDALEAV